MGYERIDLSASARVPPDENYNLQEDARRASREVLALTNPVIDYTVPADRFLSAVQTLREQTIREVREHIAGFERVSERCWRRGRIEFGVESEMRSRKRCAALLKVHIPAKFQTTSAEASAVRD